MYLVKQLTRLLEFSAQRKIAKAQRRSDKANKTFVKAKSGMVRSNQELQMTQAEVLIQLNKLDQVEKEIMIKKELNSRRIAALEQIINTDFSNGQA